MKNLSLQANLVSNVACDLLGATTITAGYNPDGGCKGDLTHMAISLIGPSTYSLQLKNILATDSRPTTIVGGIPFTNVDRARCLEACVQYAALDDTGMDFSTDYIILSGVPSEDAGLFYMFTLNEAGESVAIDSGNTLYTTTYLQQQTNFANATFANPGSMPATTSKSPSVTVCTILTLGVPDQPTIEGISGATVEYVEDYMYSVNVPYTAASILRLSGNVLALPQMYFTGVVVFEEPTVTASGINFRFKLIPASSEVTELAYVGVVLTIETTNQTW